MAKNTFFLCLVACVLSWSAYAQQNLFNIPSGDLTQKGKIFYQHQINAYEFYKFESKAHLAYGLGKGWEIGVNLINKKLHFRNNGDWFLANQNPIGLLTGQKSWAIAPHFRLNIGTQVGFAWVRQENRQAFANLHYGVMQWESPQHIKLVAGGYHGNTEMLGRGNRAGVMLGYECPITARLSVMGDWISGNNASAMGVHGLMYNVNKRFQVCLGALIGNPRNDFLRQQYGNNFINAVVLEANILTWDLW